MKGHVISIRAANALFVLGMAGTLAILTAVLYLAVQDWRILVLGLLMAAAAVGWGILFLLYFRRKLARFTAGLCEQIERMASGGEIEPLQYREDLFSKLSHRLLRLYEILQETRGRAEQDREELQSLLSDISHQTKTPVSNLKMINETLRTRLLSPEKREELLQAVDSQLDKLDFLLRTMLKTSRLEAGMIVLEKREAPVLDTVVRAINGVLTAVERKNLALSIDCPEELQLLHDVRWTSEALFNLLDNAAKYTPDGGAIKLSVQAWERYVKIEVSDTGPGIPEREQAQIFARFYRSPQVHDTEGAGLGLYLAREIVARQGGYLCVHSEVGAGSTFAMFLPRQ